MKRAGVYVFYDKDGIVDRYVPYFIQELHKVVDYIVVVVNGKLAPEGRRVLAAVADDMFVRENTGYDSFGYKEGVEYIGWDTLRQYDELVLANSSVFGPIFPFQNMFDQMGGDICDFWGCQTSYGNQNTSTYGGIPLKWGYRPDSICSNFMVFKRTVLHSYEFSEFWRKLPEIHNYYEAVVYFEFPLTKDLQDAGFVGLAVDRGKLAGIYPSANVYGALDMITNYSIPIVRRKAFFDQNGILDYCTDIPREIIRYIQKNTEYDCDLIWESLLRTTNLYDLKNWFNWNNVLPEDYSRNTPGEKKLAVIFHSYYEDIMGQYLHNLESFPNGTDFYFTTDTEKKQAALMKLLSPLENRFHIEYRLVENRGRDVSALLVGCRDVVLEGGYDLICFMHDKKAIGSSDEFSCVGQAFSDCCFENTAATADYVNNVIDLFDRQPRLGIAVSPPPKNASYWTAIGGAWGPNYGNTAKLLKDLGVRVPIDPGKPPVAPYGTVFWFRPAALGSLFKHAWKYEDFNTEPALGDGLIVHAIERAYGFVAQSQGYYTAVIMNHIYAEQEVTRMTEIAHTYVDLAKRNVGGNPTNPVLHTATGKMSQLLIQKAGTARRASGPAPLTGNVQRSPMKNFARGICPIGLWDLFRRVRCAAAGTVYVEPYVQRGPVKAAVRACTPRFIWDGFRRAKCRRNGWIFVED